MVSSMQVLSSSSPNGWLIGVAINQGLEGVHCISTINLHNQSTHLAFKFLARTIVNFQYFFCLP